MMRVNVCRTIKGILLVSFSILCVTVLNVFIGDNASFFNGSSGINFSFLNHGSSVAVQLRGVARVKEPELQVSQRKISSVHVIKRSPQYSNKNNSRSSQNDSLHSKQNSISKLSKQDILAKHNALPTELSDVFISVKTTKSFHKERLDLLLETWWILAKDQVQFTVTV